MPLWCVTRNERLLSGVLELYFDRLTWPRNPVQVPLHLFQPNLIICHIAFPLSSPLRMSLPAARLARGHTPRGSPLAVSAELVARI
jgi:hypothetical protein